MKKAAGKSRQTRQKEATERKVARSERTSKQQLELIEKRPGQSKKEKARLLGKKG
jgi:hypothetical protein